MNKTGRKKKGENEKRRPVCITLPPKLIERMKPLPYSHSYMMELGLEVVLPYFEACSDSAKGAPEIFRDFIKAFLQKIDELAVSYPESAELQNARNKLAAFVDQFTTVNNT